MLGSEVMVPPFTVLTSPPATRMALPEAEPLAPQTSMLSVVKAPPADAKKVPPLAAEEGALLTLERLTWPITTSPVPATPTEPPRPPAAVAVAVILPRETRELRL